MKQIHIVIMGLWVCCLGSALSAEADQRKWFLSPEIEKQSFGGSIYLEGSPQQIARFENWLGRIAEVEKGRQTLHSIRESGHELIIRHSKYAVISGGRTLAPNSENLTNGKGESATVLFSAHIQDSGSHMVYNSHREMIEFTAVQNLYHELAHAMHMMKGSWRYFASEAQAIEEENIFRRELALIQNTSVTERWGTNGVLISNVDDIFVMSEWSGPSLFKISDKRHLAGDIHQTATGTTTRAMNWHQSER